jgi:hypothetical protein
LYHVAAAAGNRLDPLAQFTKRVWANTTWFAQEPAASDQLRQIK